MSNTNIGFTINIEGLSTIEDLNKEIAETNKELKKAEVGTKKYAETSERLAKLKAEQKALRKNQTELTKSFLETSKALGSYDKASAKLNRLRKEFKNLAIEGKASTKEGKALRAEIEKLDKKLKQTDATVGQFQRNVGNYPRIFGQSTKAIFKQIPALDKLNQRLEKATGVSNILGKALVAGFIAFKAAGVLVDLFKQFDELVKKIDEVRNSVAVLAGVGGEDLDKLTASVSAIATTFGVEAEQINKSASALSNELGISFEEALGKIEEGLLSGVASNEEFLSSIEEAPEAFTEAGEAITDYGTRQNELLQANKALAEAQIELTNEFSGAAGGVKTFATQAQTFLIKALLQIVDIFKPVVRSFRRLGKALSDLFSSFNQGKEEFSVFASLLNIITRPIRVFAAVLGFVVDTFTSLVNGVKDFIKSSPLLTAIVQKIQQGFALLNEAFKNLPFIFAGIVASLKQIGTNFTNFFRVQFLNAQIFAARVKGVFGAAVKEQIADLKRQQAEIKKSSKTLGAAFAKGFNDAKRKADEEARKEEEAQAKANEEARKRQLAKEEAEKRRIRLEEQRKTAEALAKQRAKEREKFLAEEAKFLDKQAALIGKLRAKQEKLILQGITDAEEKARAKTKKASENRIKAAETDFNKLVEIAKKREEEALRLFGADSEELKKVQAQNIEALAKGEEQLSGIRTRERIALTNDLLAIEKKFIEKREKQEEASFNKAIQRNKTEADLALAGLERRLEEGRITEEEFSAESFKINKERIEKELELIQKREKALEASSTKVSEEENQKLLLQKEKLYTELAKLDNNFSDLQKKNQEEVTAKAKAESDKRLKAFQEDFKEIASGFTTGLKIISDIQAVADERRKARIEEQEEANKKQNEELQESLSNATGLEAQFLEQKIEANNQAAEAIAKEKERIEKQQAKKAKARAIIESIIQTALAVVEALPNVPLSIVAGVSGAAATATIAAQPLATGGVVGELGKDIIQFNNGGKVTNKGNIKPLSNGDNVLATLKTGEVVLNKKQQARIGGAKVLKAAGVPNFAEGGLVGSPTSLIQKTTSLESENKSILSRLEQGITSTNERIDRIQILWTSETQDQQDKGLNDREQIKANATF